MNKFHRLVLIALALMVNLPCQGSQYLSKANTFSILGGKESVTVMEKDGKVTFQRAGKGGAFSFNVKPGWLIYDNDTSVLWAYNGQRQIIRLGLKPNGIEAKVCVDASDFWKIFPTSTSLISEINRASITDGAFPLILPPNYAGPSTSDDKSKPMGPGESWRIDGADSQRNLNVIFLHFEPVVANTFKNTKILWREDAATSDGDSAIRRDAVLVNPGNIAGRPSSEMVRLRVDASNAAEANQLCKDADLIFANAEKAIIANDLPSSTAP